jgi:hypothetical protein
MFEGYRGYSVRKEYGCAPGKNKRFQCVTIQEEAANTIQYFWRKWKGKTIYQQLLLYRAAKQQELTYFCQQVRRTFLQFDSLFLKGQGKFRREANRELGS